MKALGAAYLTNFAALAATVPFLALYLEGAGFAPAIVAQILAVLLLVRVVAVPPWTLAADRSHAGGRVLRLASAGALVAFAALLLAPSRWVAALVLLAYTVCRAPFGPLLDSLMLRRARDAGQSFGAVRAAGTAGYALGAIVTGALVARVGNRAVVYAGVGFLAAALVAATALGRGDASPGVRASGVHALVGFVRRPRLAVLLGIGLLVQLGLAPYDALFPAYLTSLAGATAAGVAVALGAGAEFLFLLAGPTLAKRLGPERLLALSCMGSAVRWAAVAGVTSPVALVALQVLHALSFGAFYVSAVVLVDAESPPGLRASALGVFSSLCFGVEAAGSLSLAGVIERHAGLPAVFALASGAAVLGALAAGTMAWIRRASAPL
jgi:PPP family 3-phenylpropionic acid transporter